MASRAAPRACALARACAAIVRVERVPVLGALLAAGGGGGGVVVDGVLTCCAPALRCDLVVVTLVVAARGRAPALERPTACGARGLRRGAARGGGRRRRARPHASVGGRRQPASGGGGALEGRARGAARRAARRATSRAWRPTRPPHGRISTATALGVSSQREHDPQARTIRWWLQSDSRVS